MPIRRDPRSKRWFFRTTVRLPDGRRKRISGTPGIPGPYQDCRNTKVGAQEAERRAIQRVLSCQSFETPKPPEEVPTIKQFSERFLRSYKPKSNPSTKRCRDRILKNHIIPILGSKR